MRESLKALNTLTGLPDETMAEIFRASYGRSPLPYLHDPAVRERARGIAQAQGLLARIEEQLTPEAPIPALQRSAFRAYARNGSRLPYDPLLQARLRQIEQATIACWLGMDYVDYLQDLLWAECETTWWFAPAHEYVQPIDLSAAMRAERYDVILSLLGEQLEEEVRARVRAEIDRRVLAPFLDPGTDHLWWRRTTNNWNAVCHGGIGIAAMLLEQDPERLTRTLMRIMQDLPVFIDGFTPDGGCSEGPSYWRYGFGWYVRLADALYHFTNGQIHLLQGERLERICRYPLAVVMGPGQELTFADAYQGYQSVGTVCRINRYVDIPELYGLCQLLDGCPALRNLDDLLLYDGRAAVPLEDPRDYLLPDLGVAKVKQGAVTLGVKAGHNDEHHNHNDIGSFIVHRGSTQFLCDPGGPVYTAKTFSPQRYECAFTNSYGHSVPVIDGCLQQPGRAYAGTLTAEGLNTAARKVVVEMAGAYGLPALQRLTRTLTVAGEEMLLADTCVFTSAPATFEEAFLTTLPAEVLADGSVAIRSEADGTAYLAAVETPGSFRVDVLYEESKDSYHGDLLRRIVFTPATLGLEMRLAFRIRVTE